MVGCRERGPPSLSRGWRRRDVVMESDPVLSRDEIEALLSAIRAPEEDQPVAKPWDFQRPRRLLAADLERLREIHVPFLESAARLCGKWLNAPVQSRLLTPTESTPAEILAGKPGDSLLARAGDILIDPSPAVAFALLERAMGSRRLTRPPERPLRDLEAEVLSPAIATLLEVLSPAWAPAPESTVRWGTASALGRESWPEGSVAVLVFEILSEGVLGDIVVAVPLSRFDAPAARRTAAEPVPGVDIEIAARFPLAVMRLGDLRDLAPGDLLVWSGDSAPGVIVEVSKQARFTGRPGTLSGNAAVEVLKPAGMEPAPVSLVRISGGGVSPGVPEVPVEVRAVLAERSITLRDLGALRPGARLEFPRPVDAPAELRLGRRVVARGPVIRSGDRFAIRVEKQI